MADDPSPLSDDPNVCIDSLPDEILLKIMNYACEAEELSHERVRYPKGFWFGYRKICHSMAIVSRRFHRIANPLLYYYACLVRDDGDVDELPLLRRIELLCDTLNETPSLRQHVEKVNVYVPDRSFRPAIYENIREILCWLPNLRFLGFVGGNIEYTCKMLQLALANLSNLTCLSISDIDGVLDMGFLFQTLNGHCSIDKIAIDQDICSTPEPGKDKLGTVSFKQLEFVCHGVPWPLLGTLLHWPQALHTVILHDSWDSLDMFGTEISVAIKAVSPHKQTLKKLEVSSICTIDESANHNVGISSLPALEELTLSRWSFSDSVLRFSPKLGIRLLGPSLRKFTLSFQPLWEADRYVARHSLLDMGPDEEAWLVAFGTFAAEQRGLSKLESIHVHFAPHPFYRPERRIGRTAVWPWDRLQSVAEKLVPYGIKVTWSEPTCTRLTWRLLLDAEMEQSREGEW